MFPKILVSLSLFLVSLPPDLLRKLPNSLCRLPASSYGDELQLGWAGGGGGVKTPIIVLEKHFQMTK
jgi:hypothetical protein